MNVKRTERLGRSYKVTGKLKRQLKAVETSGIFVNLASVNESMHVCMYKCVEDMK